MSRYQTRPGNAWHDELVVDTSRPLRYFDGSPMLDFDTGEPLFAHVCECGHEEDAERIAAALNAPPSLEWSEVGDPPATSGEYLVWAESIGRTIIADYSTKSRRWTTGVGWERETLQAEYWANVPEPDLNR